MSGNVSEWVNDWYGSDYYKSSPKDNPKGPNSGAYRAHRGGCWSDIARFLVATYRDRYEPPDRGYDILGFRVAFPAK